MTTIRNTFNGLIGAIALSALIFCTYGAAKIVWPYASFFVEKKLASDQRQEEIEKAGQARNFQVLCPAWQKATWSERIWMGRLSWCEQYKERL